MDYLSITGIVLVVLNLAISFFLAKRDDLNYFQKLAQIVIVWVVPFVGAIGLWLFNRSQDDDNNKPGKGTFGGGSNDSIGAQ